jgi:hypothetical protein
MSKKGKKNKKNGGSLSDSGSWRRMPLETVNLRPIAGLERGLEVGKTYGLSLDALPVGTYEQGSGLKAVYPSESGRVIYEMEVKGRDFEKGVEKIRVRVNNVVGSERDKDPVDFSNVPVRGVVRRGSEVYVPGDSVPSEMFMQTILARGVGGKGDYLACARSQNGKVVLRLNESLG